MGYIEDNNLEKELKEQIPEAPVESNDEQAEQKPDPGYESMIGKHINVGANMQRIDKDEEDKFIQKNQLSRKGESILKNNEIREGWMDFDKNLLGERSVFYPSDWEFKIRPATVEAIRNWSTIDDENSNSIDRVFNEVLKSCLAIETNNGPIPWYNINAWDRFFFILIIKEYTFQRGETKIEYTEDCSNCDKPVTFELTSGSLLFDMPDQQVMSMYDQNARMWIIDPTEYGLEGEDILRLYLPTLEKDINVRQYLINRYQENPKKEFDPVLIKFLPWFMPKISKDDTIAQRQIKEFKHRFESWDIDTFNFFNDVLTNIIVTPSPRLIKKCPVCGEEVTSLIRFPNGPSSLFHVESKFKKFGSK